MATPRKNTSAPRKARIAKSFSSEILLKQYAETVDFSGTSIAQACDEIARAPIVAPVLGFGPALPVMPLTSANFAKQAAIPHAYSHLPKALESAAWESAAWESTAEQDQQAAESKRLQLNSASGEFTLAQALRNAPPILVFMARVVIYRLENPKARENPDGTVSDLTKTKATKFMRKSNQSAKVKKPLSPQDKLDVFQQCAAVLAAKDAFQFDKPSRESWKAAFKSCRAMLRMNNTKSAGEIITETPADEIGALRFFECSALSPEERTATRSRIAKRLNYWRSCISAAFNASASRKRKAERRTIRNTASRILSGEMKSRSGLTKSETREIADRLRRFQAYLAQGETILDLEAQAACEERQALRKRKVIAELQAAMASAK